MLTLEFLSEIIDYFTYQKCTLKNKSLATVYSLVKFKEHVIKTFCS